MFLLFVAGVTGGGAKRGEIRQNAFEPCTLWSSILLMVNAFSVCPYNINHIIETILIQEWYKILVGGINQHFPLSFVKPTPSGHVI